MPRIGQAVDTAKDGGYRPRLFSNSGPGVKLSVNILAGSRVLSAVGTCPPHDGVG